MRWFDSLVKHQSARTIDALVEWINQTSEWGAKKVDPTLDDLKSRVSELEKRENEMTETQQKILDVLKGNLEIQTMIADKLVEIGPKLDKFIQTHAAITANHAEIEAANQQIFEILSKGQTGNRSQLTALASLGQKIDTAIAPAA